MISATPSDHVVVDPVAALAFCLCEGRPLLTWAVEFAGHEDPLPLAWTMSRDALAMAVTLALAKPGTFVDAMKSIPNARFPNATGDTMQVIAMLPDAMHAHVLPALVGDARRMLRRLPTAQRELLETTLCSALRRAAPTITFDAVIDSVRDRPQVRRHRGG